MSDTHETTRKRPPRQSFWRLTWRRFRRSGRGMFGLSIVGAMFLIAALSPLLATNQPIVCKYEGKWYFPAIVELLQTRGTGPHWIEKSQPFNRPQFDAKSAEYEFEIWPLIPYHEYESTPEFHAPPSAEHWLGTDEIGRDIAARAIHGTAIALKVGFVAMGIATVIGLLVGSIAGYFGRKIDLVISRIIEIVQCFPTFFLILAIIAWLEPNIMNVMIVIGLTRWTGIARYTRGEFMRLKESDFVMAARAIGASPARIMFRQVLPNSLAPVMVSVTFGIAGAIMIEAGLSWLGFGVQAPTPSWGSMLRGAYESLRIAPHMVLPPCVAIFLAVLAYNLIGDAFRDAIDPRIAR